MENLIEWLCINFVHLKETIAGRVVRPSVSMNSTVFQMPHLRRAVSLGLKR